ncbi:MAG: hypothetical protein F6K55_34650 [Moorea sp. SIO4A3]|nr:hypothetical protein [Moorena sp. SIO4A3]
MLDSTGATCASIEGFTLKKVTAEVYETSSSPVAPPDLHPELRQGMSGVEGAEAFRRILNQSLPQVLVSTQDFAGVRARNEAKTMVRFKESALPELREFTAAQWQSQRVEATETVQSSFESQQGISADTGAKVVEIFCQVLGVKNIGLEDDFFELNGDSLQAIMVTSRIRDIFGVDLSPDALFDYSTAAELAKAIQTQNQPVIDQPPSQSEDVEEMFLRQQVDNLSDEEVEAMLGRLS